MSLTQDIREYALDLGYSVVGFTTADGFPDYATEITANRKDMYDWYVIGAYQPLKGVEPRSVMPEAKSIIVTMLDCYKEAFPEKLLGKIGRLYMSRAYLSPRHRIAGARRQLLRDFLEQNKMRVASPIVVPERLSAARAGAVDYGNNTFVFMHGSHSYVLITAFVVDTGLEYDNPTMTVDCPPHCTACIDACPTKALYEPLKMNPKRCIAYNCFITQDNSIRGVTSYIPYDIREKMGTWIHGCDTCQDVCPRNQKRIKAKLPPNEYLEMLAQDFDLTRLLHLTPDFYQKRVFPLMYNYIRDLKVFQRNAAIALGNMKDTSAIPDLALEMENKEPVVRATCAWALGRIGGKRAKAALESALKRETTDSVIKELNDAIVMA
jgi:epoxyqueuosine reductase